MISRETFAWKGQLSFAYYNRSESVIKTVELIQHEPATPDCPYRSLTTPVTKLNLALKNQKCPSGYCLAHNDRHFRKRHGKWCFICPLCLLSEFGSVPLPTKRGIFFIQAVFICVCFPWLGFPWLGLACRISSSLSPASLIPLFPFPS